MNFEHIPPSPAMLKGVIDVAGVAMRAYGDCYVGFDDQPTEPPLELERLTGTLPICRPEDVVRYKRTVPSNILHRLAPDACDALRIDGFSRDIVSLDYAPRYYSFRPAFENDPDALCGEDVGLSYHPTSPGNGEREPELVYSVFFDQDNLVYRGLSFDYSKAAFQNDMEIPECRALYKIFSMLQHIPKQHD